MTSVSKTKQRSVSNMAVSMCSAALLLVGSTFSVTTMADGPAPLSLLADGDQLTGSGSSWFPIVPLHYWQPFSVQLPLGARYANSNALVTSLSVDVVPTASTGLHLPKERTPEMLFVITGDEVELDTPMTIVWPNVHRYSAGEAHLIFSYDPTGNNWNVCGVAMVSADQTVLEHDASLCMTTLSYYFVDSNAIVTP